MFSENRKKFLYFNHHLRIDAHEMDDFSSLFPCLVHYVLAPLDEHLAEEYQPNNSLLQWEDFSGVRGAMNLLSVPFLNKLFKFLKLVHI